MVRRDWKVQRGGGGGREERMRGKDLSGGEAE